MEETFIVQLISSVGFPIAITTYYVVKNEKTLKELTNAITQLKTFLELRAAQTGVYKL